MGLRRVRFVTGEIYHVYNRSIVNIPIFQGKQESELFLECSHYYNQERPPIKFSVYRTNRERFSPSRSKPLVTVLAYCIMPTHFHYLLRQEMDNGLLLFIKKISNSFAHYYSLKHHQAGHIFTGNFRAVHIEDEYQLLHVSRYIHLNPVTAYLTELPETYAYSSYKVYVEKASSIFVDPSIILGSFRSRKEYQRFTMDNKDYQRKLAKIKHLLLE